MNLFDLPAAQSFAQGFSGTTQGTRKSPNEILSRFSKQTILREGTNEFSEVRDALIRHSEMGLLLSASNVCRSLDLMRTASAPWAQVTLYYGAWHASTAVLGILGGHLGGKWWIGAESATVGKLALRASSAKLNSERGSHQRFWHLFYDTIQQFEPWIDAPHKGAATPVNGDPLWMITERNLVNYQHLYAESQAAAFAASFDRDTFPSCLSGPLATQYHLSIGLLDLALWLAEEVGLVSDVLARIGAGASRQDVIAQLVMNNPSPQVLDNQLNQVLAQ